MTGQISVSPDHLRQVATKFRQASDQSQQMVQQLGASVHGLENEWRGLAQQRFFQDYQGWTAQMRTYVQLLNSVNQDLQRIAAAFEQTDRTAAGHSAAANGAGVVNTSVGPHGTGALPPNVQQQAAQTIHAVEQVIQQGPQAVGSVAAAAQVTQGMAQAIGQVGGGTFSQAQQAVQSVLGAFGSLLGGAVPGAPPAPGIAPQPATPGNVPVQNPGVVPPGPAAGAGQIISDVHPDR